ncbi:hypothetical protein RFI_25180 [Reticulomyxa filosa]|uniref:Threonine synthase N-terminal domain-containing protein n=1 Tax=Reticulomyxa filosa TaxID=46433 RepID=X6MET2_RETFI|nr:hypothetical protein RFI_25180 [Reticulomyxa filosa]|eukprot:ETO12191.1 hypothetical protein RFI_25180 [Reticulomyxa filosa]
MSKTSNSSDILYQSTRGGTKGVAFRDIVFSSYAPDGGLYVPEKIPIVTRETLQQWSVLSFPKLCAKILSLFVDSEIRANLDEICSSAFEHFHHSEIVPVKKVGPLFVTEAFHGPTLAFKDIGLSVCRIMYHLNFFFKKKKKDLNKIS